MFVNLLVPDDVRAKAHKIRAGRKRSGATKDIVAVRNRETDKLVNLLTWIDLCSYQLVHSAYKTAREREGIITSAPCGTCDECQAEKGFDPELYRLHKVTNEDLYKVCAEPEFDAVREAKKPATYKVEYAFEVKHLSESKPKAKRPAFDWEEPPVETRKPLDWTPVRSAPEEVVIAPPPPPSPPAKPVFWDVRGRHIGTACVVDGATATRYAYLLYFPDERYALFASNGIRRILHADERGIAGSMMATS